MDGSFHAWLEGRGPRGCLMNMVDDATGTTSAGMGAEETIWAAAGVLRAWVEKYGVPLALYTDWKNVYVREPSEKELLRGEVPVTQFGRMCQRLGIRIIAANSAPAKGRVERNHGTHQDRLVKKMRLKKIATYAEANEFLEREYLPEHNRRFAKPPASGEDYHHPAPKQRELQDVFHLETERVISNDWVVRYENRYFQVQRQARRYAPAKTTVKVCAWEDGRLDIRYRDQALPWKEIAAVARTLPSRMWWRRSRQSGNRRFPGRIIPGGGTIARCAPGELRRRRCSPCLGLPLRLTEERACTLRSQHLAKINSAELDELSKSKQEKFARCPQCELNTWMSGGKGLSLQC
jgi:hypothetical protein